MNHKMLKPVEGQLEAYNRGDIDAFMLHFSEGCVVEDGAGQLLMQGWDAMHASYKKMFEASPELHCNLVSRIVLGEYILDEERVTGRNGSTEESHVVAVYKVENGQICHIRFLR
ncbi:MAG: nuclear transport factor 2 family protein [Turicibacter sp.]|nr:nuclear transport factor 2 family protein [Turicibacter sp.]